ncbi:DoxX-like protein [Chryseobacterium sp. 52]|uniref:DoxX family protein n=1 Tax=Chryseobacterium sp. 52 TaxID=2035213 RepID=UPI000C17D036|nr:DoxX family protein [Chryseobacterium sp. 52]PIF45381.1 DoxX-like protein [Chryseobacterium sp. 52]
MKSKGRKVMYWLLTVIVAIVFVGSAMAKLMSSEQSKEMVTTLGGERHVVILGILELFIAGLWIFSRTAIVGALLAIAYLGGATAVHFVSNQPVIIPVILQVIVWIAVFYRFPELWQRLFPEMEKRDIKSVL